VVGRAERTKSFTVTCFDPDAPTGSGLWHSLVVNISATVIELPFDAGNPKAGKPPAGALQTRTDLGMTGYFGPCPPPNDHPHRDIFTVFAVSQETLAVTTDSLAARVGLNLKFNTLVKASLMGLFKRWSMRQIHYFAALAHV
jgi:Raf kinase inhibitor-like YbhB/YbcL family protein